MHDGQSGPVGSLFLSLIVIACTSVTCRTSALQIRGKRERLQLAPRFLFSLMVQKRWFLFASLADTSKKVKSPTVPLRLTIIRSRNTDMLKEVIPSY